MKKIGLTIMRFLLYFLLPLSIGAGGVIGIVRYKPEWLGLPKTQQQVQSEAEMLLTEVGKLISLPTDEQPTIATVADTDQLKEQSFFKNAQNGDKVIIYTNTRKAILYRQSEKKIIEVGAVNINQQMATPTPTPVTSPEPSVQ